MQKSRKQELTGKKDREKERASAGEGGETLLNNAVNYSESRARERRWNNTEQCREPKLTRAIERRRKYQTNWLRRLPRSEAVQPCKKIQKSHQQEKSNVPDSFEKLQNSKRRGKSGWFVDLSKIILQFSLHNFCCKFLPGGFTLAELNCQIAVSDFCCGVCYEN